MFTNQLVFTLIEHACTHQCPWCLYYTEEDNRKPDYLGLDMIEKFCELNKDISLPVRILPPGEPLLHPQLFEIMMTLHNNGFPINGFYSNLSVPMTDEQIDVISYIDSLVFNMSFFEGEEKMRDISVDNFRRIHSARRINNPNGYIQSGINKSPIKTLSLDIEDLIEIIYPNIVVADDKHIDDNYQPEVAEKIKERLHSFYGKFKNLDANSYIEELPESVCNLRTLATANNGSYIPCCSPLTPPTWVQRFDFTESNIFKMSLEDIESSDTFKSIIKERTESELYSVCRECNGLSIPQFIPWEI